MFVPRLFKSAHQHTCMTRSFSSATAMLLQHHQGMKAVVIDGTQARLDSQRQLPKLRDDCVLVRPVAVALNPTDWRHIRNQRAKDGCILGCDYAGVVQLVGSAVTKNWKPGDKIFGCAHGANLVNPDDGIFAEYASVIGDLQMRMPEGLSFEKAATIGLGAGTVGQGLFQKSLGLQLPEITAGTKRRNEFVLIYGGGTATGALGIQFAKEAGYSVVTVCADSQFEYAKGLGAEFVVDYMDPKAAAIVREYTNNKLKYAWDTISIESSALICAESLTSDSSLEPVYGNLLPVKSPREDVKSVTTVMHTIFGREFQFGPQHMPASKEDFEFGRTFYNLTEQLLAQGRLRPHACHIGKQGLQGVIEGLSDLEAGKVIGAKLVYKVAETP